MLLLEDFCWGKMSICRFLRPQKASSVIGVTECIAFYKKMKKSIGSGQMKTAERWNDLLGPSSACRK